jgi:hypothetical protein
LEGQLDGLVDFTAKASQQSIVDTQKALKTLDEIEAEDAQKRLEDEKNLREQIKKASIALAQDAADAIFEIESQNAERRIERRMDELEMQEAAQLALVEGNAQAEMQVREDYAAQREQLEREEFERKKRMDIAQAIMNGALGITAAKQLYRWPPLPRKSLATAALLRRLIALRQRPNPASLLGPRTRAAESTPVYPVDW